MLFPSEKNWNIRECDPALRDTLSDKLNIHPTVVSLLINRGVSTVEDAEIFLSSGLSDLHDPFLLTDMDKAVNRIRLAKSRGERVLVFGDYDVDGVTSLALMFKALRKMDIDVCTHIPHRMNDGYGLNEDIVDVVKEKNVSLLITVDCGITAVNEVALLNNEGIDVVIIDHHEQSNEGIPDAVAVVDPKREGCKYPFPHLAAVGLVGKLTHALFGEMQEDDLDLIALGTIADVVPLVGENRIFVKAGLPRVSKTENLGLEALMEVSNIAGKKFKPYHAGYILGPRINASGRMGSAQKSLDLLLSEDQEQAILLAEELNTINAARQKLQKDVVQEALNLVDSEVNFGEHKVIVVSKEGWHKGVLGIAASRLAETFYRPTIIISLEDGVGTASARSIKGFHLNKALAHCSDILESFGGHKLAAGLTIREEKIKEFTKLINNFAHDILEAESLYPSIDIDAEVSLFDLSLDLVDELDKLEPYGEGNRAPIFCTRNLTLKSKPAALKRETLKFWVSDGQISVSAVGFGMAKYCEYLRFGQKVDLAYELCIDDWNKAPAIQLKLKDIKLVSD